MKGGYRDWRYVVQIKSPDASNFDSELLMWRRLREPNFTVRITVRIKEHLGLP